VSLKKTYRRKKNAEVLSQKKKTLNTTNNKIINALIFCLAKKSE